MAFDILLRNTGSGFDINLASGNQFNETPTDNFTLSEQVIRELDLNKIETLLLTEVINKALDVVKQDDVTITEAISLVLSKEFSDNLTYSDSLNLTFLKNPLDTIVVSDSLTFDSSKNLLDTFFATDSLAKDVSRVLSDSFVSTDIKVLSLDKQLSDTVSFTDVFSYQITTVRYIITTRQTTYPGVNNKGLPLSITEMDDNFINLNLYKLERVISSVTSAASIAPSVQDTLFQVTALANDLVINTPLGTPGDGQRLIIKIRDNGSAHSITWAASYRAIGVTLPTTTNANKFFYAGIAYNLQDLKWDVISVSFEE